MSWSIIGNTVKTLRLMTDEELEAEGWSGERAVCLEFADGTLLFASRDEEGNGPGCLMGQKPARKGPFRIVPHLRYLPEMSGLRTISSS